MYMQHHAILLAGTGAEQRLFHWSYRRGTFEPGVLNGETSGGGPAITCVPAPSFTGTLAILLARSSDDSYVRFSDRETYRIPNAWQPKWSGGMSPHLRLGTTAPAFRPLDRRWSDLQPAERDAHWLFIEWNPQWLLNGFGIRSNVNVVERSMEFGLTREKSITRGRDGKEYTGYHYVTSGDGQEVNITQIGCGTASTAYPKSCQHHFINKGKLLYFRHRPEDVADWEGMQQRVIALMDTFEVRDAR
jgi:hypothetical protein